MHYKFKNILSRVAPLFELERVICRLVAAWCTFAAYTLLKNEGFAKLEYAQDTDLFALAGFVALFFVIYSVAAWFFQKYETDSILLILPATVCVFCWLSTYEGNGTNEFLFALAVIVVYSLFLVYFINRQRVLLSKIQPRMRTLWIFTAACGIISAAVIAYITCLRYKTYSAPNYDFGIFCQMFHYMKTTGLPMVTCERNELLSHFAVHISPIYYILLPFYYIFPSPLTLQIGQAVVLASGVVPVLLLARKFKLSQKASALVVLIYAFFPAISTGCFYDIHENCFLAPILLWLFYFFEKEKWIPMYISAVLVLAVKEDAAMYIIFFALFVILSRKKYLQGTILAVGALAYFGLALHILSTYGDGVMVNRFDNLIYDQNDGLLGALKTALLNPGFLLTQLFTTGSASFDKLVYLVYMLLPLGILPFCSGKASRWLLLAPMLMNTLTYYPYQFDIGFQYQFGITAFLIYAMIMNIPDLKAPTRKTLLGIGAAACCCFYIVSVFPKVNYYRDAYKENKDIYDKMDEILETIPEDASLNVSTFLLPHVADREYVYEIDYHNDQTDVDYVVFDIRYGISSEARQHMAAYLENGYEIHERHDGFVIILIKTT
jgi:uncharacterized membrane protein